MQDDPLALSLKIAMDHNYHTRTCIDNLLHVHNDVEEGVSESKAGIINSTSSKRITYKEITHSVYKGKTHVNEHHRAAFTRFRVRPLPRSRGEKVEQKGSGEIAIRRKTLSMW